MDKGADNRMGRNNVIEYGGAASIQREIDMQVDSATSRPTLWISCTGENSNGVPEGSTTLVRTPMQAQDVPRTIQHTKT